MSGPTINESWLIDAGDVVIQNMTPGGVGGLSPIERLLYCVWVADYGMRNAGDLEAARDVYADFHADAARLARELRLPQTHSAFALPRADLEREYFDRFEAICEELRSALG